MKILSPAILAIFITRHKNVDGRNGGSVVQGLAAVDGFASMGYGRDNWCGS